LLDKQNGFIFFCRKVIPFFRGVVHLRVRLLGCSWRLMIGLQLACNLLAKWSLLEGKSKLAIVEKRAVAAVDGWRRVRLDVLADCAVSLAKRRCIACGGTTNQFFWHPTLAELFECVFPFKVMETKLYDLKDEGSKIGACLLFVCRMMYLSLCCSTRIGASHEVGHCGQSL
jgi:hypothetical protein